MWGTSLRQRARLLPLFGAIALADRLASIVPPRAPRAEAAWRPGISIVIPERDSPSMLMEALASLYAALAAIGEPHQVIVVVNGARRDAYEVVRSRFPGVEWIHDDRPLGFAGAIERGVREVRHDGVYLMNNDVTLDARAIAELLPLRAADVFAIGSQIFQQSEAGRREETGFTDWMLGPRGLELFHAMPRDSRRPVPELCASGGAALFRTSLLRRYLPESRAYDPFYWEDVEWSLRAWREGHRVVFCPASKVTHRHRATTARFYRPEELARIVERNRILFDMRHGVTGSGAGRMLEQVCDLPYESQRELAGATVARGVLRHRIACRRTPQPLPPPILVPSESGATFLTSSYSFHMRADEGSARRRLLLVTPFCIFPPRHGGARRVAELIRGLREEFDIALVTDEATLYDVRSLVDFEGLCGVRLVQRKGTDREAATLRGRMSTHCHPALSAIVRAACQDFDPDVVQVEHAELAPLIDGRQGKARWVLDLHDAYGATDLADSAEAHAFSSLLDRYDALVVCSEEDRRLLGHRHVACVPNGAAPPQHEYRPSTSSRVLFVGPFRYEPNYTGIVEFLRYAWPAVRAAVPTATLQILGGDEHAPRLAGEPAFAQPGVEVCGHREDVAAILARSALSINPLSGIRGSAIKVAESLVAGRVCVSTMEGARGFDSDAPRSLVTVADVASMARPIIELLTDADARHEMEVPVPRVLRRLGWSHSLDLQQRLYRDLLKGDLVEKEASGPMLELRG